MKKNKQRNKQKDKAILLSAKAKSRDNVPVVNGNAYVKMIYDYAREHYGTTHMVYSREYVYETETSKRVVASADIAWWDIDKYRHAVWLQTYNNDTLHIKTSFIHEIDKVDYCGCNMHCHLKDLPATAEQFFARLNELRPCFV